QTTAPVGLKRRRVGNQPASCICAFADRQRRYISWDLESLDRNSERVRMGRKKPVVGTVFSASDRHIQQAVRIEILRINLGAGHRRENFEFITRQAAVVT